MEYIAFDAHKHYTHASVARPDGQLVREERVAHDRGALRHFLERCEIWPPPRPVRHAALTMVEHGECFLALGRTEEASALAHDALEHARQFRERGNEARALAFLATVEARRAGAEGSRASELYEQAMAMAEELGMRPLVARCHLDAGCLWLAAGHRASACEHLERAAATFRELDMSGWLAQAESALRGQAGTTEARSAP